MFSGDLLMYNFWRYWPDFKFLMMLVRLLGG